MLALVTAASASELDTDLPLIRRELPESVVVAWDDTAIDWSGFDAAIIRSTWDYHARRAEFLDWARHVASVTRLWNPVDVIEWNTDKRYLLELEAAGIPIVPTTFVSPGEPVPDDVDLACDVVVKPSVGAGSVGVLRPGGDVAGVLAHIGSLHAAGSTAMIQPYLADVDQRHETGLVFFGRDFSHAFAKWAILDGPITWAGGLYAEERIESRPANPDEVTLGERVVGQLPDTAYARVDLLPTPDGPVVLEVELIEPSLFLHCDPGAAERAAAMFRNLVS